MVNDRSPPRRRLYLATVMIAAAAALSGPDIARPAAARWIPASSGSCITMTADPVSGYDLVNHCSTCRSGLVEWCDGEGHPYDVRANGAIRIPACPGIQVLVTDVPCEHPH